MKKLSGFVVALLLSHSTLADTSNAKTEKAIKLIATEIHGELPAPKTEPKPPAVGADKDAHGCIGSAGYAWCERTKGCERPWELAKKEGFELSAQAFNAFCQQVK